MQKNLKCVEESANNRRDGRYLEDKEGRLKNPKEV